MPPYVLFRASFSVIRLMQSWLNIAGFCSPVLDLSNVRIRITLLSEGEEDIKYKFKISIK
jgi:hypothetical protein